MIAGQRALVDVAEDSLSTKNFDMLAGLINDTCGIQMPPSKRTMLEGRLRRRVRALGLACLDDYCGFIFDADNLGEEFTHFINAVTTNKTDFFREPQHFDYLVDKILPELAKRGSGPVRVWSAASSTGAEPYTLAMVLEAFAADHPRFRYGILATDIDTDVLADGRRGIYAAQMADPIPADLRSAFIMEPKDATADVVRIVPALRSVVGFAQLNLMDPAYPVGKPMDIIFCRNVLIYFDKPTQRKVVSRLVDSLAIGGYLFLGHSEGAAGQDPRLALITNTIYRRK